MNIAIVDDEPVFLKQLHNRLREMKLPDCEIHEFTSGRDLLSFYVKGMYEVIILDVEMPDLTGLQTAERIRQIDGSVIISFLTNYAEFAVKGYDVGAFRYILKNQPDYVYTKQLNSIIAECQQRFRTFTFKALRKNLCKFKNCDKSDILERLKNNRSNFFTVYNGYCNLSRFFGYQPAGMERSGMESG